MNSLSTTLMVCMCAAILLLKSPALHAQMEIDGTLPEAITASQTYANEKLTATDTRLVEIRPFYAPNPDSGTSARWWHIYYSPSLRRIAFVVVEKMSGQNAAVLYAIYDRLLTAQLPPVPIDISTADHSSATFARKLRESPQYQAYRAAHPGEQPFFQLRALRADDTYRPAEGPVTDDAVWLSWFPATGDSILASIYIPSRSLFAVNMYYCVDVLPVTRYSIRDDLAVGIVNDGRFGHNTYNNGGLFQAPRGSTNTFLSGAGIWIGAKRRLTEGLVPRVFMTYGTYRGDSWATPGEASLPRTEYSRPIGHGSSAVEWPTGEPAVPGETLRWPLWMSGSDTPSMMNPGKYVMKDADRIAARSGSPAFVAGADEQFVVRFHDRDLSRYRDSVLTGFPFGLQIQQNVYAGAGGVRGSAIVQYEIVNVGSDTLFDAVLAPVFDFDLGTDATDDRSSFVNPPAFRTVVASNKFGASMTQELAITLIEGPVTDSSGRIDNARRGTYRTQGRVAGYSTWLYESDPVNSEQRYALITADKFASSPYGDYRGAMATQRFTMYPGDTAYAAVSYMPLKNRDTIGIKVLALLNAYYGAAASAVESPARLSRALTIVPNPVRDYVRISTPISGRMDVIDALGVTRLTTELPEGTQSTRLDVRSLSPGRYAIVVSNHGERVIGAMVIVR